MKAETEAKESSISDDGDSNMGGLEFVQEWESEPTNGQSVGKRNARLEESGTYESEAATLGAEMKNYTRL